MKILNYARGTGKIYEAVEHAKRNKADGYQQNKGKNR